MNTKTLRNTAFAAAVADRLALTMVSLEELLGQLLKVVF
jgi:hypothetical protein